MSRRYFATIILMSFSAMKSLIAQSVLPQGVGAYAIGARFYAPQSDAYDQDGKKKSIGSPYSKDFNGKNLLSGAGGNDLTELANQLRKFDANNNGPDSLVNTLRLGRLNLDVSGNIDAKAFGFGYGVTNYLSLFTVVPWISAAVDVDVNYVNDNNIPLIRQRIGELAFEDLKSGFERASLINTQQIVDSIATMGYEDLGRWQYQGLGDIILGGVLSRNNKIARGITLTSAWQSIFTIPTGHYDDPGILTDVSLGKGYYYFGNQFTPAFQFSDQLRLGLGIGYGYGVPTTVQKRVPEANESLVNSERTADVNLRPGADLDYKVGASYTPWVVRPGYTVGISRHMLDEYSGGLPGNYDKLSEGTDREQLWHEFALDVDTSKLYQQGRFAVPFFASVRAHYLIAAKNSLDDEFYDVGIVSFFKTPWASTDQKKPLDVRKKSAPRSKR